MAEKGAAVAISGLRPSSFHMHFITLTLKLRRLGEPEKNDAAFCDTSRRLGVGVAPARVRREIKAKAH